MKLLLLFAFFAGVVLLVVNELLAMRPPRVEYRYLPKDLDDYLREAPSPGQSLAIMFKDAEVPRVADQRN